MSQLALLPGKAAQARPKIPKDEEIAEAITALLQEKEVVRVRDEIRGQLLLAGRQVDKCFNKCLDEMGDHLQLPLKQLRDLVDPTQHPFKDLPSVLRLICSLELFGEKAEAYPILPYRTLADKLQNVLAERLTKIIGFADVQQPRDLFAESVLELQDRISQYDGRWTGKDEATLTSAENDVGSDGRTSGVTAAAQRASRVAKSRSYTKMLSGLHLLSTYDERARARAQSCASIAGEPAKAILAHADKVDKSELKAGALEDFEAAVDGITSYVAAINDRLATLLGLRETLIFDKETRSVVMDIATQVSKATTGG